MVWHVGRPKFISYIRVVAPFAATSVSLFPLVLTTFAAAIKCSIYWVEQVGGKGTLQGNAY